MYLTSLWTLWNHSKAISCSHVIASTWQWKLRIQMWHRKASSKLLTVKFLEDVIFHCRDKLKRKMNFKITKIPCKEISTTMVDIDEPIPNYRPRLTTPSSSWVIQNPYWNCKLLHSRANKLSDTISKIKKKNKITHVDHQWY